MAFATSPLDCVPLGGRDDAETKWSFRLKTHDDKGFNANQGVSTGRHVKAHAAKRLCENDGTHVPPGGCAGDCRTDFVASHVGTGVAPEPAEHVDMLDLCDELICVDVLKPFPAEHVHW